MGVPGLWKELAPAGQVRSLTELAVVEGFEANPNGSRGYRIGIDASIWFFHANYGKEGENPQLRTLFFRCATLTHAPFLPLFVFDGPHRPKVKRGKNIRRETHSLTAGMKEIVEAFGFEWRVAPGEAEAELAYLNRIGVLDGILSDDVDNFLFGATVLLRNPSNTLSGNRSDPILNSEGRDDKNHTRMYRIEDITAHPKVSLTRGDMILIGLCSGGDYDTSGWTGCGPTIAKALARYGFGRSLYEAGKNLSREQLSAFLYDWRNQVKYQLLNDEENYIGSKRKALAASLPDTFPDIDILLSYINPLTSESAGRASDNLKLTWDKEPDLGKLAATCELKFEWGYRDMIIKRFKTVIWHGAVLRILRRGVLEVEGRRRLVPSTPSKNGKLRAEGTPSKMITERFSSLKINPIEEDDEDDRLITKITRERRHASTDNILEYRLEIRPRQLVLLAESGLRGIKGPPDNDVWEDLETGSESEDEGEGAKKTKQKKKLTPEERLAAEQKAVMVWMPASMVRIAEPSIVKEYEEKEEAKRLKKAGKGGAVTKRKPKAKTKNSDSDEDADSPSSAKPAKKSVRKAEAASLSEEEGSGSNSPSKRVPKASSKKVVRKAKKVPEDTKSKSLPEKAKAWSMEPFPELSPLSSDDDELPTFLLPKAAASKGKAGAADPFGTEVKPAVRDLTKGKGKAKAGAGNSQTDASTFFPLEKAIARSKGNATASAPVVNAPKACSARDAAALSAPSQSQRPGSSLRKRAEDDEDDDRRVPETPSKNHRPGKTKKSIPAYVEISDTENEHIPPASKLVSRARDDRLLSRAKHTITSSEEDERASRVNKSPRKSAHHASPRDKAPASRALSPTPDRARAPVAAEIPVIDISSDSDSPPPPTKRPGKVVRKAVLQPTNLMNDIIDLSD